MTSHSKCIKTISLLSCVTLITALLSACAVQTPKNSITTSSLANTLKQSANQNEKRLQQSQDIPDTVSNALLPKINLHMHNQDQSLQRYDMVVNNAPAATFFQSLAKDTNDNLIVSPKVAGNISLNVHHMTLPQILNAVHKMYGYRFEKTNYGYNIYPKELVTKVFHVSYLNMERTGVSETTISSGSISSTTSSNTTGSGTESSTTNAAQPASTVTTHVDNKFWQELKTGVAMIIGQNSSAETPASAPAATTEESTATAPVEMPADTQTSVLINPQAGLVIVKAYPDQLDRVAKYLRDVENIMHREVMIQAKILEVKLNSNFQSGIDWNVLGVKQSTIDPITDAANSATPLLPGMGSGTLNFMLSGGSNLNATVKLLSTQGRVNTLSSPHITTVNNQKALIKIGSDDYFITGVTSNTTSSSSTTTSENVDMSPFFSGIALDVTPEIDGNGDITLHIHPIISKVVANKTFFNTGTEQEIPLASSTIRESDNIVRVKNNQIIMIGGMMEDQVGNQQGGTPFLSKIPIAGNLFKRQDRVGAKTEIVILLQPRLMTSDVANQLLRASAKRFSGMKSDFSFDTLIPPNQIKSKLSKAR